MTPLEIAMTIDMVANTIISAHSHFLNKDPEELKKEIVGLMEAADDMEMWLRSGNKEG